MNRGYLINHLIENDCYPEENEEFNAPGVAQLWHNAINGEICYIPYDENLSVNTYCHVLYELKVSPPMENGYDSDYDVYSGFRQLHQQRMREADSQNPPASSRS